MLGNLRGLDQAMNACLSECVERVYSKDAPVNFIKLGVYMIRGDTIAVIGNKFQRKIF
jgi:U6 snRNA-associated Sm-like protein LSm8